MDESDRYNMAVTSAWLGVTAVLFVSTVYIPVILGGVAVVLAVLSRNRNGQMLRRAKFGMGFGIVAVAVAYLMVIYIMYTAFQNPQFLQAMRLYVQDPTTANQMNLFTVISDTFGAR